MLGPPDTKMTTARTCELDFCPRKHLARGLCRAHRDQEDRGIARADMRPIGPRGRPKARHLEGRNAEIRRERKGGALYREITERHDLSTERIRQICKERKKP